MDPSENLASAMGLEHHHPILGTLGVMNDGYRQTERSIQTGLAILAIVFNGLAYDVTITTATNKTGVEEEYDYIEIESDEGSNCDMEYSDFVSENVESPKNLGDNEVECNFMSNERECKSWQTCSILVSEYFTIQ